MSSYPPHRARFVTACQQVLALGVVLAFLTPAASVISLDVVPQAPIPPQAEPAAAPTALVPTADVEPVVTDVPLTAPSTARVAPGALQARTDVDPEGAHRITSEPQPVTGYGAVGVTWEPDSTVDEDTLDAEVRTLSDGVWSEWSELEYHDDHGPDPASDEALGARPGTEPLIVGDVDEVQVQIATADAAPADLKLSVIDPGEATESEEQEPAIVPTAETSTTSDEPALVLSAAAGAPKPTIYSRAQWGADERWRDKGSLRYGSISAGFVHHTVNANDYTAAEVPGILRSIYSYHTKSRGWSDIGYNFLVDRFGRIWEGRYGGVSRPVVGAHTLGYNDYAFAMSAIGNFEIARPTSEMIAAYGALFAWKLGLHGVDPASTRQKVGSKYFPAVNGHRDAGSTACPGVYLYAQLAQIRRLASRGGAVTPAPPPPPPTPPAATWKGRLLGSNLASTAYPDLIVRRVSDGKGVIIPTGGLTRFSTGKRLPTGWGRAAEIVASPDLTGDGHGDVLVVDRDGQAVVRPGNGRGRFGKPIKPTSIFEDHDEVTAVGDLNGDGDNDLVARMVKKGRLDVFLGGGKGGFTRKSVGPGWGDYNRVVATGDVTGDGLVDVMARDRAGQLWLHPGTGNRSLAPRRLVPGGFGGFDTIVGFGDHTRDGRADLFVRRADNGSSYVLPGRGDGTFAPAVGPFGQFAGVRKISAGGNLTGDAMPDVFGRKKDRVVAFAGGGTFNTGAPIVTSLNLKNANLTLNAGDFDRDGLGDVITRMTSNGRLLLRRGDGSGGFAEAVPLGDGFGAVSQLGVVGDLNGDGFADLIGLPAGGAMTVYPGRGAAPLGTPFASPTSGSLAGAQAAGLDLRPYDWIVEVSDLDADGRADLVVRERATGFLFAVRRNSSGGFVSRWFLGEGMRTYDLAG